MYILFHALPTVIVEKLEYWLHCNFGIIYKENHGNQHKWNTDYYYFSVVSMTLLNNELHLWNHYQEFYTHILKYFYTVKYNGELPVIRNILWMKRDFGKEIFKSLRLYDRQMKIHITHKTPRWRDYIFSLIFL